MCIIDRQSTGGDSVCENGEHFEHQIKRSVISLIRLRQSVLHSQTFRCSYLMFGLCVMLRNILCNSMHMIAWNTYGCVLVKLYVLFGQIRSHVTKNLQGYHFSGTQCISAVTLSDSVSTFWQNGTINPPSYSDFKIENSGPILTLDCMVC